MVWRVTRKMKILNYVPLMVEPTIRRSCFCSLVPTVLFISLVVFLGSTVIAPDYKEKLLRWGLTNSMQSSSASCKSQCRPYGSEVLPKGIVASTSNLDMRPLWGSPKKKREKSSRSLFTLAAGIKQKELVNKMVKKFLSKNFVVMLFHYDGIVDAWRGFEWSNQVIHISAANQTKWWFAKRFLHPDVVAEYKYIFLWDEDLGVEYFRPDRYLSIVETEGLEISQPALDPRKSEVHHLITVRGRRSTVHRRTYKPGGVGKGCDNNSTAPPCTGWVEMMAPVFSRAAWRCAWYMIQNDLIHAWGLDMQLGYCAQGDRMENIGVVDAEYIVHYGFPTLGSNKNKVISPRQTQASETQNVQSLRSQTSSKSQSHAIDPRFEHKNVKNNDNEQNI
ncbi:Protein of unknown function DUF707 [Dillenia turbinata]|uniref:Uncharacterized protein n=1 Tax=Dillenia turbinata TaxID=194707 RepID=A0AAN8USM0_9MAGN